MSWAVLLSAAGIAAQAQTLATIGSLNNATGAPAELLQGTDGNFYGIGGLSIFEMTPGGTLTSLYNFASTIGGSGVSLLQATDGNFYGTASDDGLTHVGTVFKMTPAGTLSILFSFDGVNGVSPTALIQASDGNLYGVTTSGGVGGSATGTIFKITPQGTLTTLHIFAGSDGAGPADLTQGADGNFYGVRGTGGSGNCHVSTLPAGCGTVFKMTPAGSLTTLYVFQGSNDGASPCCLVQGTDGNLYGLTGLDGANGYGTAFQLTPAGKLTTLYNFGVNFGGSPTALIQAKDGNLYGAIAGNIQTSGYQGSIFRMTLTGTVTDLYTFCGTNGNCPDGSSPQSLVQSSDGNLYGVTSSGGANGTGTVFKFSLTSPNTPAIAASGGVLNGASFQPGISSGSWMTINGTNLSTTTGTWNNSIINGALPTILDGVGVTVGGQPAYIEYISPTQINAVAPNVTPGSVPVIVKNSNGTSESVTAQLAAEQPAFFQWGAYAVATRQDFSLAVKNGTFPGTTTVPAKPGDVIILWGTGFGVTSPSVPQGLATPSTSTYNTGNPVSVKIGNQSATVYGAALAPGYAGLYQVAIQIPASLADGDYPVVASTSGADSPSSTMITVQQ
jgi:uncharacterized protein (TIGR03437 family)